MSELNNIQPLKILSVKDGFSFTIEIDTSKFNAYTR
jgi:hypothetical protein